MSAKFSENPELQQSIHPNRLIEIWRLMGGYRLAYAGAVLSLGIAAVSKTGTYLLLRFFADRLANSANLNAADPETQVASALPLNQFLPLIALGFVGLAIFEGSFTFLSGRWAAFTAEGIARRLRNYLYDHLQHLPFSYHDKTPTGEMIQRCTSDVDALRRFFADQAIGVGRIVLLFIVNFTALLQLHTQLALLSVIVVPFVILLSVFFFRRVTKAYEEYQEQDGILTTTLQENLAGVRVVKAFARQPYEIDKFERDNNEKFLRGRRLLLMHSIFWPLSDILCGAQMLSGFTAAAILAINGEISVGTYLAYAGLVIWLIWPMRNLGRLIVQTSTGLVSYGRLIEIIRQEREPLLQGDYMPGRDVQGQVEFDNVSFKYDSALPVLEEISFQALPGQAIALLGSTGSGKTSLVNLLPRFYEYTSGSIRLDGVELKRYPRAYLRKQIGIVEQEPFLFSRTIRENILFGVDREVTEEEIISAAQAAAVHNVISSFPKGYDTLIGEKGVTLSGGQKQRRPAIARTLLKNPRLLILDDATSSVDSETEAEIRLALKNLMQNRTTFIIAHRIQSVMRADLILVLEKGRIIQRGTHTDLITQEGVYRQVYDLQTRIESELQTELVSAGLKPAALASSS